MTDQRPWPLFPFQPKFSPAHIAKHGIGRGWRRARGTGFWVWWEASVYECERLDRAECIQAMINDAYSKAFETGYAWGARDMKIYMEGSDEKMRQEAYGEADKFVFDGDDWFLYRKGRRIR